MQLLNRILRWLTPETSSLKTLLAHADKMYLMHPGCMQGVSSIRHY